MEEKTKKKSKRKIIKRVILSFFGILLATSILLPQVDKEGHRNIGFHAGLSFLKSEKSEEVDLLKGKIGGIAEAVCHPNQKHAKLRCQRQVGAF